MIFGWWLLWSWACAFWMDSWLLPKRKRTRNLGLQRTMCPNNSILCWGWEFTRICILEKHWINITRVRYACWWWHGKYCRSESLDYLNLCVINDNESSMNLLEGSNTFKGSQSFLFLSKMFSIICFVCILSMDKRLNLWFYFISFAFQFTLWIISIL